MRQLIFPPLEQMPRNVRVANRGLLGQIGLVKTLEKIEADVRQLSVAEQEALRDWLDDLLEDRLELKDEFKAEIEAGVKDIAEGRYRPATAQKVSSYEQPLASVAEEDWETANQPAAHPSSVDGGGRQRGICN